MALTLLRSSWVTAAGSTPKTRPAVAAWKSCPEQNAAASASSPDRCAMIRSSIWL